MIRIESQDEAIVVYGAGDHGRVVAEAAVAGGLRLAGFVDDGVVDEAVSLPAPLLGPLAGARTPGHAGLIVAIGDNDARARALDTAEEAGWTLVSVVHPAASVAVSASIGPGAFVGPGAVVHSHASVGRGCIVNSGAVVEHHNIILACAHIGPGAALGGRVTVGARALVGLNAAVLPGMSVGEDAILGAGAVLTRPLPAGACACGVPAAPR